jgi:hypothetical protein
MRQHLVERGHLYPKECLHSRYATQENRRGQGKHALVPRMKRRARDVVAARAGIQHTVTRQPPLTHPYVRNARTNMPRAFQTARQLSHDGSKNNSTHAQACPDRHEGLEHRFTARTNDPLTHPYVRNARTHMPRASQTARQLSHDGSKNNNKHAQACPDRHEGLEQPIYRPSMPRRNDSSEPFQLSTRHFVKRTDCYCKGKHCRACLKP